MEMNIINIGNSQGIRIPVQLLKQLGINDVVDAEIVNNSLVIKAKPEPKPKRAPQKKKPREGWDELFAKYADKNGEPLIDEYTPTKFDEEEWE
jgi:antitoxin MazE